MTAARQVLPDRTYLISRRCTQRQMLLRPEPAVEELYLYCLGEAASRFGVVLNGYIAMSNHQHLVVRDVHGNFPDFLAHLNKMIAKTMNVLRGRTENFWSSEQPNAVYLVEAQDRFDKLVYLLTNPVKANLVEHAVDWPGPTSIGQSLSGRSRTVKRPRLFFDPKGSMPPEVVLTIERLAGYEHLSEVEWIAKLHGAVRRVEEGARRERAVGGSRVMGRKAVMEIVPTSVPTSEEEDGEIHPSVACRDRDRFIGALVELASFREERHFVLLRYKDGDREAVFPFGTFRVRGSFKVADDPTARAAA